MSKSNKIVREKLEKMYGKICMMHQGLKIKGYSKSKVNYTGKAIERQLTLHHIKPKSKGGATSVENGAVLCRGCHDFLEQSDEQTKNELNRLLVEYKKVKLEKVDDVEIPFEFNFVEISIDKQGKIKAKRLKEKEKREEKRELQMLKKEWEDR